jgi:hypothetical protein
VGVFGGSILVPLSYNDASLSGIHSIAILPGFGVGTLVMGCVVTGVYLAMKKIRGQVRLGCILVYKYTQEREREGERECVSEQHHVFRYTHTHTHAQLCMSISCTHESSHSHTIAPSPPPPCSTPTRALVHFILFPSFSFFSLLFPSFPFLPSFPPPSPLTSGDPPLPCPRLPPPGYDVRDHLERRKPICHSRTEHRVTPAQLRHRVRLKERGRGGVGGMGEWGCYWVTVRVLTCVNI